MARGDDSVGPTVEYEQIAVREPNFVVPAPVNKHHGRSRRGLPLIRALRDRPSEQDRRAVEKRNCRALAAFVVALLAVQPHGSRSGELNDDKQALSLRNNVVKIKARTPARLSTASWFRLHRWKAR